MHSSCRALSGHSASSGSVHMWRLIGSDWSPSTLDVSPRGQGVLFCVRGTAGQCGRSQKSLQSSMNTKQAPCLLVLTPSSHDALLCPTHSVEMGAVPAELIFPPEVPPPSACWEQIFISAFTCHPLHSRCRGGRLTGRHQTGSCQQSDRQFVC